MAAYKTVLRVVDTAKALEFLSIEFEHNSGKYINFKCPDCQGKARITMHGHGKNLWYCQDCKQGGNIIKLTRSIKNFEYEPAITELMKKCVLPQKKLTEPVEKEYELEYNKFIEDKGVPYHICELLGVGIPKGKSMLSGCVAFLIRNDEGVKIAYYGIRIKNERPHFYKTFCNFSINYGSKLKKFGTIPFHCAMSTMYESNFTASDNS